MPKCTELLSCDWVIRRGVPNNVVGECSFSFKYMLSKSARHNGKSWKIPPSTEYRLLITGFAVKVISYIQRTLVEVRNTYTVL